MKRNSKTTKDIIKFVLTRNQRSSKLKKQINSQSLFIKVSLPNLNNKQNCPNLCSAVMKAGSPIICPSCRPTQLLVCRWSPDLTARIPKARASSAACCRFKATCKFKRIQGY